MELLGKLKNEMAQAKSKDEAKEIMENAGMKLTDDELDTVAGGMGNAHFTQVCNPRHGHRSSGQSSADYNVRESHKRWEAAGRPDLDKTRIIY